VTVPEPHGLPRSLVLACWLQACVRGLVSPDEMADAVRGEDPNHLVVIGDGVAPLVALPGQVCGAGATAAQLALPAPGDPVGLAGPAAFNTAALEAGEGLLLPGAGIGLVPRLDARTVVWQAMPAHAAPVLDPGEAGATLRRALLQVTDRLAVLDVAAWRPEIPDLLMNLRHRDEPPLPPGLAPRRVEAIERAALCLTVVRLALEDDGGAVSSYEMQQRRDALGDLDRAARRALVAAGSDSLGAS
jgi:hypothetical protein